MYMRHDAIVIGGSFAGLSAAIHIARARRPVCVIDAGRPRNRFAAASHGFFGQDGLDPRAMIARARAQLMAYRSVTFIEGEAVTAEALTDGYAVTLGSGEAIEGSKLLLATGISDVLPELPGLLERWGKSVLHCPYCHGFEFAGQQLGVLATASFSAHQAMLIADWGPTTLYLNGGESPDDATRAKLTQRGVTVEPATVLRLEGTGDRLTSIILANGQRVSIDALYIAPRTNLNGRLSEQLGCALDDGPFGPIIRTDAAKLTTVPGVYAAGDVARTPHNATWASADGVTAGVSLHQALVFEIPYRMTPLKLERP
jgi:thioredoxin reductase